MSLRLMPDFHEPDLNRLAIKDPPSILWCSHQLLLDMFGFKLGELIYSNLNKYTAKCLQNVKIITFTKKYLPCMIFWVYDAQIKEK